MPGSRVRARPITRGNRGAVRGYEPVSWSIVRFVDRFGWDTYCNDHWDTEDGVVPWRVFYLWSKSIENLLAADRLNMSRAMLHAQGLSWAKDTRKLDNETKKWIELAYPELKPR